MEFRTRTAPVATFEVPTNDTSGISATYSFNNSQPPINLPTPTVADGLASVQLPYLQKEGIATVNWSFSIPSSGSFVETVDTEVVTPLLTPREVREVVGADASDYSVTRLEASVRYLIQAVCGTTFGKYDAVYQLHGDNDTSLELPYRLLELESVNDETNVQALFEITGGGWALAYYPFGVPEVKADIDGLHYTTGGVIVNPWSVNLEHWNKTMVYRVSGTWGYARVPEEIKEAARILINDLACADSEYRDRWLTSMTAADWRIQFNDGAFYNTGNARADKLIEPFIMGHRWVAI